MTTHHQDAFVRGLQIIIEEEGWKMKPVSEAAGMSESGVRDLFRNASSPKVKNAHAIAHAINRTVDEVISIGEAGSIKPRTGTTATAVAGRVGAGAQVDLVDGFAKGDGLFHVLTPAELPRHGIVAVEIEGDSMEPIYEAGGVIFYSREVNGVPSEAIGKICIAECEEGKVWLKQVKPGTQPGLFHLLSLNMTADPMYDRKLKWAAPVRQYLPPDLVRKHTS